MTIKYTVTYTQDNTSNVVISTSNTAVNTLVQQLELDNTVKDIKVKEEKTDSLSV